MITRRELIQGSGAAAGLALATRVDGAFAAAGTAGTSRLARAQTPTAGGTLISASTSSPTGLDPHSVALLANYRVTRLMYSPLVNLSAELVPIPALAESWEMPDDVTYIFHLRSGVTFHSGKTMTSADVKYSLDRILDEATGAWARGSFASVASAETPDDATFKVRLSSPFSGFIAAMFNLLVVPAEIADQPADYLMTNVDGTGPFMLESWTPDVDLKLVRHPGYWEAGLPYLDGVTIRVIPEENSILSALETGEIDHYVLEDNKSYAPLESEGTLSLVTIPAMGTNVVNINHRKEELQDERVRQALSLAMNRSEILQIAGSDVGVVSGPIPPTHQLYSVPVEELAFYETNIEQAKALLAEAGYPDGFSLDILYIPTYPLMELSAITLAAQWAEIGIKAEPRSTDIGVWLDLRTKTYDYYISTNLDFPTIDPDVYLFDTF
ncbi:MAG: ABC transporter substrate-binding protein, partial [Thermomicrobiales bacterium]|nr:ABC transporter substrate-binding protein [Thermomicrobiales bacterium]